MLRFWKGAASRGHEEVFVERYRRLYARALHLTNYNQELAEDLLHDIFVHFTLARPDLGAIQNLDAYLFTTLRNMHLSHLRRVARMPVQNQLVVDFDSAAIGLRALDQQAQLQVRDELVRVCRFACRRKQASKAGSAFILRFLHGYYPSEIARILRNRRRAADDWLRIARREIREMLEAPPAESPGRDETAGPEFSVPLGTETENFLRALRGMVFESRKGDCLPLAELQALYRPEKLDGVDCELLAHIVSCQRCLEAVSLALEIPEPSERHPEDSTGGRQQPPAGGAGGSSPPSEGGGKGVRRGRRRASDVFEHRPKQLFVSVNGFVLGSHTVSSETSEQTLTANLAEKLGFAEVFSEQGIRLLWLNLEPPPDGPALQQNRIGLSEGRWLSLQVDFSRAWPRVHVKYQDPAFDAVQEVEPRTGTLTAAPGVGPAEAVESAPPAEEPGRSRWTRWPEIFQVPESRWWRWRPAAAVAVLTIAALILYQVFPPPLSAAVLVSRAARYERQINSDTGVVVQRALEVEQRSPGDPSYQTIARVEIWRGAAAGIQARRVYDREGALVAGVWSKRGEGRRLYRPGGAGPTAVDAAESPVRFAIEMLWGIEPSATAFSALVPDLRGARVEETDDNYIISYGGKMTAWGGEVSEVVLWLTKEDLHPVMQSLFVTSDAGVYEYRLVERHFQQHPSDTVEPRVFELDPELRPSPALETVRPARPRPTSTPLSREELLNLEVETLVRLDEVRANLGEQVTVRRLAGRRLEIRALVEEEGRKDSLVEALGDIAEHPAVTLELTTIPEAIHTPAFPPPEPDRVHQVDVTSPRTPVYAALLEYFASPTGRAESSASGATVEERISRFSSQVLRRSRQALLHAWVLKNLADRFTAEDVATMSPETRQKLDGMIVKHSGFLGEETRELRQELEPIFFKARGRPSVPEENLPGLTPTWAPGLVQLFEWTSHHEQVIRRAFTVTYPETPEGADVKVEELETTLRWAEGLAESLKQKQ